MRLILLLSILACAACANNPDNKCGDAVVLPQFSGDQVQFKEVRLPTLNSLYKLSGGAAEIFFEGILGGSGYQGSVAEPKLIRSGNVCVPADTGSMVALSAYQNFEKIYFFDRELGVQDQLRWPRKVGVELRMRNSDGQTHNNAHYFGSLDAIGILPYSLDGTHLVFNPGILSHEHFHGHFQSQVLNPLNSVSEMISGASVKPTVDDLDNADLQSAEGLNRFVLRSWNEGLADLYACVFTGESDFFSTSKLDLSGDRDCEGAITLFQPGSVLRPRVGDTRPEVTKDIRKDMARLAYGQGTLLTRLIYRIGGSESGRRKVLEHVMKRLKRIPAMVGPKLHEQILDFEDVVPVLLAGYPLDARGCDALKMTVSKTNLLRSFSQCRL